MKRRYSDNDKHFGPFTLSRHEQVTWRPFGVVLDSGGGEDRDPRCHLLLQGFGWTIICEMPRLIHPWRRWVDCSKAPWAKEPNAGYWDEHSRSYGFTLGDGFLQVFLGARTFDSDTDKTWCAHLPWTQWRHVRFSLYDENGKHFWTEGKRERWEVRHAIDEVCPSETFEFDDYDGERIQAVTKIHEREWKFGDGWFKWLSLFRKPKIKRSLDIRFSQEVGPEKGSWKGGTLGHGIEMLPNELHEDAFRRYCEQEHRSKHRNFKIKFVGKVNQPCEEAEMMKCVNTAPSQAADATTSTVSAAAQG